MFAYKILIFTDCPQNKLHGTIGLQENVENKTHPCQHLYAYTRVVWLTFKNYKIRLLKWLKIVTNQLIIFWSAWSTTSIAQYIRFLSKF